MLATARRFAQRYGLALKIAAIVLLAAAGLAALHGLLAEVRPHQVIVAFRALGAGQIAASVLLTAASYFMLTLYDVLALRIIGRPLPYRTAALASLASYTLSHNFGFALLTGGSARYRVYRSAGLDAGEIVRVIATASITFWMGVVAMAAVALVAHPMALDLGIFTLSPFAQRCAGATIIAAGLVLIWKLRGESRSVRLFRWSFPHPSPGQAIAQIAIAALDLAAASGALLVLVPGAGLHQFPLFFLAYTVAIIASLLSHVPGGVGVFEAVILAALPEIAPPSLLAALIMYRIIYYLAPLMVAAALLVVHERRQIGRPVAAAMGAVQFVLHGIAPSLLAAITFIGGVVLLISGALPAVPARLHELRALLPLPFVEASHIAASLAGTGLLLIAPGLYRRLDGAFHLCRALLLAGAAFSLAKGVDYEEAVILLAIAALLQLSRKAFYRRTALTTAIASPRAIIAILLAVGLSTWIGFFSYKHVAYQSDLWWQFAWNGDASRFLRASFAMAVVLAAAAVLQLFQYVHPPADRRSDGADAALAISASARTEAMLAFTGDKRFLFSATGQALLMYQVQGQSWIVMGDPVGPQGEWPELVWRIREMADAAQGRLMLYQISMDCVPLAIDLGLQLVKYGEEARVFLPDFALDGPDMKGLRHAERRAAREGAEFAILPAAEVPAAMAELRAVSDAWLAEKGNMEKAFSVGRFDPAYLARFDCAVVRHAGRIVAFANIWATSNREELSVDLMRHVATMPYGTMDFLFVQLMKWGRDRGYRWFSLGLAPLAGIEARRLAPMWARAGTFLYRHGDAFYGFEGLRSYKDKFAPRWEPRYIASAHGVGLARALIDLQTLVGGSSRSAARRASLALVA
ncbi:bifunctional lysylphosphatidylglycerol flippase/synthetase MprF [Edaphosphingomonas haloaromaticamans]|uniref:Phosphatidylglycerol lysyltransferase n=1 Tax=Edaphosphingomonas haloaromaticamans TaxID=653954 RepID=A0A1S1HFU1_9SPHN|nr:bifunctional lysylphosphatidylglycerol flippase/synthetase MprF [Sphingomonas haloaromaticamans]OHT20341.1 Phosphatidylglycerol lysyltransferase [Sphingomonas haloaromaticamans]